MQKYLIVLTTTLPHHGCAYLAKSHAVAPAGAGDDETAWHSVADVELVYHERAAVKMRIAERAAYLKLLSDGERASCAYYLKFADAAALPAFNRYEVCDLTEVNL